MTPITITMMVMDAADSAGRNEQAGCEKRQGLHVVFLSVKIIPKRTTTLLEEKEAAFPPLPFCRHFDSTDHSSVLVFCSTGFE